MEEKRLIDVSNENVKAALGIKPYYPDEIWKFAAMTEKFPTVDAVEVVRCKDCQKCLIDNSKRELHLCMKRPSFPVRVKLDGFCPYGERKDGDGNG
ncbi:MAG: hypothetical protein ACI3V4_02355 [Faecousia sp.]